MKKVLLLSSIICIMMVSLFTSCNNSDETRYSIACNLPMTGYVGIYGEWIKNGFEFAKEESMGIIDSIGVTIEIDYQDNKGATKDAISILKQQLVRKPDIYMSGLTSQTMAIKESVTKEGLPHVLWSFTPLFLEEGENTFRTWVNYGAEAEHYLAFCKQKDAKKIAFLHIDLVGAKQQCESFVIPKMKEYDSSVQFYVDQYPVDYTDFKSNIVKIKQFNPDVLIVSGFKGNIINILKEIDTYGLDKSTVICSMDLLDAAPEIANNMVEGVSVASPIFNIESLKSETTADWVDRYKKRYDREPSYTEAYAYDSFSIIVEAIKNSLINETILQQEILEVNLQGITGHISFDKNGELKNNTFLCVYKDGQLLTNSNI